jgi:opacity protein-like surface antigen
MKKIVAAALLAAGLATTAQAGPAPLSTIPTDGLIAIRMLVAWDCRAMIGPSWYQLSRVAAYDAWSLVYGPGVAAAQVNKIEARFLSGDYKKQTGKTPELCMFAFNDLSLRIRMATETGAADAPAY